MSTKKKEEKNQGPSLRIPPPNHAILTVTVKSADGSPLIMESKAGAEALMRKLYGTSMDPTRTAGLIADRPGGQVEKVKRVRTDDVLKMEFEYSQYRMPGKKNKFGLPAAGFKRSMQQVGVNTEGINGTDVMRNIWVLEDAGGLVEIKCSKPYQDIDLGKNSGKSGSPRVISRAKVDTWEAILRIRFNQNFFSAEEVLNLLSTAGMMDGFGGKRVGKGHTCGEYAVASRPAPTVKQISATKLGKAA